MSDPKTALSTPTHFQSSLGNVPQPLCGNAGPSTVCSDWSFVDCLDCLSIFNNFEEGPEQ